MSLIGCNSANTLCLYRQNTATQSLVTIEAKIAGNDGWAGFGIGKQMIGSPLYVFWKNSTGGCVVSRRDASAHAQPRVSNNQVQEITTLDSSVKFKSTDATLKCTMMRPLDMRPLIEKDLIWAMGSGVKAVNDQASTFEQHKDQGTLTIQTNAASMSTFAVLGAVVAAFLVL